MDKRKKVIFISSLIFIIVIIFVTVFIINHKPVKNYEKELISYGDKYYHSDDESVYIYFFQDNTCVLNVTTKSCDFEFVDNNRLFLKMTAEENGNSAVAEMVFDIIDDVTLKRTSFKIGTDYDNMENVDSYGIFTTNIDDVKKAETPISEKWHKQFNLAGSKEKPYATIKLLKGNECEIDFSPSSKSVKQDNHQYIDIIYKNGLCTYNKLNDLDFIIKYTGTFNITHPANELSSYGNYVFQTKNQELKITFKDDNYNSFEITNGEWDIVNSAIYLKEKNSTNTNFKTQSSDNSNENKNINNNEYIFYPLESNDTIKTIAKKFEMDYKDILNFNNLKKEDLSNITIIKIPTNKMFSKIDKDIYTNIEKIILYQDKYEDDTDGEKKLRIYMKDGNQVVVYFNYLSEFKNYLAYKSSLEKENKGNWILYLDGSSHIELNS